MLLYNILFINIFLLFQSKEKRPLMILFSEAAITCVRDATRSCINTVDEAHYLFLKKLSQVKTQVFIS